jgi:hypothetical protein
LVIVPVVARADRIYLDNGKSFDDVVLVSQTPAQVRFRVASGEMSLPSSWVVRVEKTPGALEEYLDRQKTLAADPKASADAWLVLARWARAQGLNHGFREALLMAGELDVDLDGLPPLMARIGYALDPKNGVWMHGMPNHVTGAPTVTNPASSPRVETESRERSDNRIAEGLTRTVETLAKAELQRSRSTRASRELEHSRGVRTQFYPLVSVPVAYTASGWFFPGVPLRSPDSDPGNPVIRKPANRDARALLSRPPGSLLPVSAYRH